LLKHAYFAGGCFWCITPAFAQMPGVSQVTSGYCGGDEQDPTYADVKHQRTGHRETICIAYDPALIAFDALLDMFLANVDPFDGEGQFIDRGHSYTLAVYHQSPAEEAAARQRIAALQQQAGRPVYIAVEPLKTFYAAEDEHQDYYLKHPAEFEQELIDSGRKKEH